jgi:hypothetical protein
MSTNKCFAVDNEKHYLSKDMVLGLLNYLTLFYLDYLKAKKQAKEPVHLLPSVFLLVLYNGNQKWTAATSVKDLIEPHTFLSQFYPDFQYRLIAEADYTMQSCWKSKIFFRLNRPRRLWRNPKHLKSQGGQKHVSNNSAARSQAIRKALGCHSNLCLSVVWWQILIHRGSCKNRQTDAVDFCK